ncbi:MAG TPA: cytochrome c [Candidatus Acidoferrales bacterium]|jgi:cytochrome c|nr:cytochrome c [Candidatus Acidoferrales bacterium]
MFTLKVNSDKKVKQNNFKLNLQLPSRLQISCALVLLAYSATAFVCAAQSPNLGHPLTPDEIKKIDITVVPDGRGLPAGSGSVSLGAAVYAKYCQSCHGEKGAGKPQDQLTGGLGTLATGKPVKTPASYWPVATTLFDYIRRAMPITSPQSLSNDEVYAVTAYILSIDGIVPGDAVLDAKSLPRVKMPNRDGFVSWWPKAPR